MSRVMDTHGANLYLLYLVNNKYLVVGTWMFIQKNMVQYTTASLSIFFWIASSRGR